MRTLLTLKRKTSERAVPPVLVDPAPYPVPLPAVPEPVKEFVPSNSDSFYFIWRTGGGRPSKRHLTLDAAVIERQRLAAACPPEVELMIFRAERVIISDREVNAT